MTSIHINPQGIADEYLKCLNLCFGNWGDQRQYDWYFQRRTAYPRTDLIVLKINQETAAGSAVSYRKVALPNDNEISVGIMTGSWTLPRFRGQGCFARIIEESVLLTAKRGGALLLAFVTEENASFRQLAKAGTALFPGSYLVSTLQTQPAADAFELRPVEKSQEVIATMFDKLKQSRNGYCRFIYPTERDFCAQFVDRPGATELLGDGCGNFGIIEKNENTDILQLCIACEDDEAGITRCITGFLNHALARERRLFLYSTHPLFAHVGVKLGLELKSGHVGVLPGDGFRLQAALGMSAQLTRNDSSLLAQPGNPWFLGSWNVQSGDRA